jgi:hypothetical protein
MKRLLLLALILPLTAAGCSRTAPPKTVPSHFEGMVGSPMGEVEWLTMDVKQDGAKLSGSYVYSRNGTLREVKGDLSGSNAGDEVHLTLNTSSEAQKTLGWPATLPLNAKLGEVPREAVIREFTGPDKTMPPGLKEGSGPVATLTGALQTTQPKPLVLYNLKLVP